MYRTAALLSATLLAGVLRPVRAQQVGTLTPEVHPKLTVQTCTTKGGCVASAQSIVIDANWRWLHNVGGSTNCYTGNTWDTALCPDGATCAADCALEGADYPGTYGITTSGNALTLKFVTVGPYSTNIGSRVYLLGSDDKTYQQFDLLNQEFTFDVDVSNLPCGLNGALYFSEMQKDGGLSEYPGNKAGSAYGTGYCDAQCPHDIKFIDGEANVVGWTPSTNDKNAGSGQYGSCCSEMDIWEANKNAAAYTPHPCSVNGQYRCLTDCGDGADRYDSVCDKDGCDFNSYRMGNTTFLGPSASDTVNTNSKFTVVTQFITNDGTATGTLSEIRRFYVQNGVTIANSKVDIAGIDPVNSITDNFCTEQKTVFGDTNEFAAKGGLKQMGTALGTGMTLVMSIWDDHAANALWLDSDYPTDGDPTKPGVARGPCSTTSGVPADVEAQSPGASVTFSNIRWGDIGSTFNSVGTGSGSGSSSSSSSASASASKTSTSSSSSTSSKPTTTTTTSKPTTTTVSTTVSTTKSTTTTTTSSAPVGTGASHWQQCGGIGFSGPTTCVSPYTCTVLNAYYSQCL